MLAADSPGGAQRGGSWLPWWGRVHLFCAGQGGKELGQGCPPVLWLGEEKARLEVGVCPNVCFVRVEMGTSWS